MPKEQVYEAVGESQTIVGTKLMVGQGVPATITKVEEETVTIDANHPLAGAVLCRKDMPLACSMNAACCSLLLLL